MCLYADLALHLCWNNLACRGDNIHHKSMRLTSTGHQDWNIGLRSSLDSVGITDGRDMRREYGWEMATKGKIAEKKQGERRVKGEQESLCSFSCSFLINWQLDFFFFWHPNCAIKLGTAWKHSQAFNDQSHLMGNNRSGQFWTKSRDLYRISICSVQTASGEFGCQIYLNP